MKKHQHNFLQHHGTIEQVKQLPSEYRVEAIYDNPVVRGNSHELLGDPHELVQMAIARTTRNPSVQHMLADHPNEWVRMNLGKNPRANIEVLKKLAYDEHDLVSEHPKKVLANLKNQGLPT